MPNPISKPNSSAIVYPKVTILDVAKIFGHLAKKHWLSLALTILGVSTMATLQIIVPTYYRSFFDLISSGKTTTELAPQLIHIIWLIFGLNGIIWFAGGMNRFGLVQFESSMMSRLRSTAFDYLIEHSYSFFSNNFTGSLTQRVNRLARSFETLTDRIISDILPLIINVIGITVVLWFVNHKITYFLFSWFVFLIIVNYAIARWKLKYDIRSAELDSKLTGTLSDAITNHNSIQLFVGQETESNTFKNVNADWRKLTKFRWNIDNLIGAIQFSMIIAMEFFLFYFGVKYWSQGLIGIGVFVLIQAYFITLADRLWNIGRVVRNLYEGYADAKEMVEILKLEHEIKDIPNAKSIIVDKGVIDFKNVVFSFNQTRTVLNKVNVHINNGEKIALIGPSGAGKSTLVRLLLRLYDIHGGEILIDGQNIAKITQNSLRENISLVPQDPVLFHRTLMENIRYGRRTATDNEVIEAAKLAHCDEFIESLPQKYDTYVGERGIKLSGGERQRVAIARAILKNAPILILDEATSSLDSHSEMLIQDALDTLMKGKTTLVIAHRLSTIRKMDRIIVFNDGSVIEEGTHDALVVMPNGLYAKLWSLQAGGFLKYEDTAEGEEKTEEKTEDEDDN